MSEVVGAKPDLDYYAKGRARLRGRGPNSLFFKQVSFSDLPVANTGNSTLSIVAPETYLASRVDDPPAPSAMALDFTDKSLLSVEFERIYREGDQTSVRIVSGLFDKIAAGIEDPEDDYELEFAIGAGRGNGWGFGDIASLRTYDPESPKRIAVAINGPMRIALRRHIVDAQEGGRRVNHESESEWTISRGDQVRLPADLHWADSDDWPRRSRVRSDKGFTIQLRELREGRLYSRRHWTYTSAKVTFRFIGYLDLSPGGPRGARQVCWRIVRVGLDPDYHRRLPDHQAALVREACEDIRYALPFVDAWAESRRYKSVVIDDTTWPMASSHS